MAGGQVKTRHVRGDVWIVTAAGEHDVSVSYGVADALDELERTVGTKIVVDLTPAEFIDATVLNGLVRHRDLHERLVVVVPAASFARRLFDLLRLDQSMGVYETLDDALKATAQPA